MMAQIAEDKKWEIEDAARTLKDAEGFKIRMKKDKKFAKAVRAEIAKDLQEAKAIKASV
jgi:hypothetical protein